MYFITFCSDTKQDKNENPLAPEQTNIYHDTNQDSSSNQLNADQDANQNLTSDQTNIDQDVNEDPSSNHVNSNQEPTDIIKVLDDPSKEQV